MPEAGDTNVGPGIQGHDLLQDYLDAKGDEPYGGFRLPHETGTEPDVVVGGKGEVLLWQAASH